MELRRAGCQGCCKPMVAGYGVNEYHEVMHFRRSLSLMRESGARKRAGFVWLGLIPNVTSVRVSFAHEEDAIPYFFMN